MDERLPGGTETILVVDDEEALLASTSRILERLGYQVLTAASPEKALNLATIRTFHLLIMDVVLPRMSGLALAHKISTLRPDTSILFCSAYTSEEVLDDTLEQRPGVDFLNKPFNATQLAHAVRGVLDAPGRTTETVEGTPKGTETLLVVDDDPQTRRFLTRALERLGYHVLDARTPDQALAFARSSQLQLAIVDVMMPGKTGPELARAMMELNPRIQFLFVSGKAPGDAVQGGRVGGVKGGFLPKPFTADALGRAVREILDR